MRLRGLKSGLQQYLGHLAMSTRIHLMAGESYSMSVLEVCVVPLNEPVITLSATVNLNPPQNASSDRPPVIVTVQFNAISFSPRLGSVSARCPLVHLKRYRITNPAAACYVD